MGFRNLSNLMSYNVIDFMILIIIEKMLIFVGRIRNQKVDTIELVIGYRYISKIIIS